MYVNEKQNKNKPLTRLFKFQQTGLCYHLESTSCAVYQHALWEHAPCEAI